jgi:hypothetical protein
VDAAAAMRKNLAEFVGGEIASIARRFYVFEGVAADDRGPVEFVFQDGRFVGLDVGGDGESIRLDEEPWVDPFRRPLSRENAEFVDSSGKWTRFDVSTIEAYAYLIGSRVSQFAPVMGSSGKVIGLGVMTSTGSMRIECDADEVWVTFPHSD